MIYQEINKCGFHDAFHHADRKDNFSYEGLNVLYDHLESYDNDIELDVIQLCCDYCEEEIETVLKEYSHLESIEELERHTLVLKIVGTSRIIYQVF
jgi:hypothetical protein